jgi:hypothetical protein
MLGQDRLQLLHSVLDGPLSTALVLLARQILLLQFLLKIAVSSTRLLKRVRLMLTSPLLLLL